jgi:23S rRNA (cytosine1962-C5)-methyltransferase
MKSIRLRDGKERSLLRHHPWVFEGSIDKGKADPGETVRVEAADGRFLAWGAYSPSSMIRVRAWSFDEAERIDAAFFARRIERALALRRRLPIESDGLRLVHGEADGLPGLIVDRYADTLSVQFLSAGMERWKSTIAAALRAATGAQRLYERSDASVRKLEGLEPCAGWLHGDGATEVAIREHGWRLNVDVAQGHKTGFYLDQRDNRALFAQWVRQLGLRRVLNCYCYTGGFSVAALVGGAEHVTSVDSSAPALQRAAAHVQLNGFVARVPTSFEAARHETADADVNQFLRERLDDAAAYDAIVLDPPKFAPTAASAERAARAYKDINRLALKLLAPGGLLFTFSCSGGISADLFHKILAGAAVDAGADGPILRRLEGAPDHPTTLVFPEGEYLKGLAVLKT